MYKYLSLNKEGFSSKNSLTKLALFPNINWAAKGPTGSGKTAVGTQGWREDQEPSDTSIDENTGERRSGFNTSGINVKNDGDNSTVTAENMGKHTSGFKPKVKTKNDGDESTDTAATGKRESGFKPKVKTKNDGDESTDTAATVERESGFNPADAKVTKKPIPVPNTVKGTSGPGGTPAPSTTTKVPMAPKPEVPTKPEEMTFDTAAADQIDIPEVKQNPDAKIPGPEDQTPAETQVSVLPLNVEDSEIPDPADVKVTVPEPPPLHRFGYLDPASTSIAEDIFSAQNLRKNVLPGVGIAAGIGGLAGAFMEDSNPIMTALGTGAGAGAGTLLWEYLSRNEDTQKYIKDLQEWAGKNLWEGANGHVKYLAPALGGLAGLLISK